MSDDSEIPSYNIFRILNRNGESYIHVMDEYLVSSVLIVPERCIVNSSTLLQGH